VVTGIPACTAWHVLELWQPNADGQLVRGWEYSNAAEALRQTGAFDRPGDGG